MRCILIKQSENLRARPIALETGLALECPVAQHYLVTTRNAAGPTAHPEKRAALLSPLAGRDRKPCPAGSMQCDQLPNGARRFDALDSTNG